MIGCGPPHCSHKTHRTEAAINEWNVIVTPWGNRPWLLHCHPLQICHTAYSTYIIPVLSRKSDHGRCILLSHQTGGWALFRVFPHSTLKERPPLFTYSSSMSSAIAAIEQQARVRQSPPSTSTSLESLATSPLTTSSSLPPSAGWGPASGGRGAVVSTGKPGNTP